MSAPLELGVRATPAERPTMIAAGEQLSEVLADPGEARWPVRLRFMTDDAQPPPPIVIATLRGALDGAEDAAHLRAQLIALHDGGAETVFLCTLLRHVDDPARRPGLMPRLRTLNLAAVEMSHALGLAVIDVDRVLALFGAVPLQTDYRLGGPAAPEVAAHVIVAALLGGGLDAWVDMARQARAIVRHGDIHAIATTVDRRLQAKAARATPGA